jgi:hypothetical protein
VDVLHVLYEVEDDVFGEEDFDFVEVELSPTEHVPADGGRGPKDHAHPLCRVLLELVHFQVLHLALLHQVHNFVPHLYLPLIAEGHYLGKNAVVAVGLLLVLLPLLQNLEERPLVFLPFVDNDRVMDCLGRLYVQVLKLFVNLPIDLPHLR